MACGASFAPSVRHRGGDVSPDGCLTCAVRNLSVYGSLRLRWGMNPLSCIKVHSRQVKLERLGEFEDYYQGLHPFHAMNLNNSSYCGVVQWLAIFARAVRLQTTMASTHRVFSPA